MRRETDLTTISPERSATGTAGAGVHTAFCVAHAPQIYLMPKSEDHAAIEQVHEGYRLIARRASELSLDALCVVALDHLHNHFLDLVPSITLFTGDVVVAEFNGATVRCEAAPELANGLLDHLLDAGFDPAFSQREVLDHSFMIPLHYAREGGLSTPVIPLVVNAYVPPQPSITRCAQLGGALADWASVNGVRLGVVATGGMSHFPGTDRFWHPDVAADHEVLDWLTAGEAAELLALTADQLDARGMVELRTWAVAIGARGPSRKARVHSYHDSGHCGYAVVEI